MSYSVDTLELYIEFIQGIEEYYEDFDVATSQTQRDELTDKFNEFNEQNEKSLEELQEKYGSIEENLSTTLGEAKRKINELCGSQDT